MLLLIITRKHDIIHAKMVSINRPEKLRGLSDIIIYVFPGASDRKGYIDILEEARKNNLTIVHVW